MNGRQDARKHRRHRDRRRAHNAALIASILAGCTCSPDFSGAAPHVTAHHDDWCPMVGHGTQVVVYPRTMR